MPGNTPPKGNKANEVASRVRDRYKNSKLTSVYVKNQNAPVASGIRRSSGPTTRNKK